MTGHTPGPWRTENAKAWDDIPGNPWSVEIKGNIGPNLATLQSHRDCENPTWNYPDGEAMANARLIAAAPDLLEALEVIRTVATPPHHERALRAIRDIAAKEIAKAKGE